MKRSYFGKSPSPTRHYGYGGRPPTTQWRTGEDWDGGDHSGEGTPHLPPPPQGGRKFLGSLLMGMGLLLGVVSCARATTPPSEEEATITSDEMEIVDHGAQTIFTGHVVLTRAPYHLTSDRMVRFKETRIVQAQGHIQGTWMKPDGEKLLAEGDRALYNPQQQTTELWDHARLTHWQIAHDTAPVVTTAQRFIADEDQHTLSAKNNVHMEQGTSFWTSSDEGQWDRQAQRITLWGQRRTVVHWEDRQSRGHFLSDRAILFLAPKRVRLIDHVQGRITPFSL